MLSVVESFKTGKLELLELPLPVGRPGFVVVANRASLISAGTERAGLDLAQKTLAGKAIARPDLVRQVLSKLRRDGLSATIATVRSKLDAPLPLGYSSAGVVIEVGRGVDELRPGDRVACAGAKYATHSDVVSVPKNLCVRIPDSVAFEEAAYVTLGAIAMHGVRQANLALGETAAVVGCGLLGLITVQILSAAGVRVLATDLSEKRLLLAATLGAAATSLSGSSGDGVYGAAQEFTRGVGFDAVLVTAAAKSDAPMRLAEAISRDRGKVVVVGDVGMSLRRRPFYEKELTLIMSRSYGPGRYDPSYEERGVEYPIAYVRWGEKRNLQEFLSLIADRKVNVAALTTHTFPIHNALAAYDLVLGKTKEPFIGIILQYTGDAVSSQRVNLKPAFSAKPESHVGVALIGAGAFAQAVLLPAIAKAGGAEPVAIVSAGGLSAAYAGRKFNFRYAASSFEEVLADGAVNAVAIATRHNLHASQVAQALRAGKHVYVEKPLAVDSAGLEEVRQAYTTSGKVLMAGFNRRWSPHAAAAKALFSGTKRPISINYRVNAGVVPQSSWVQDGAEGGGRVLGEVCHFIDLAAFFAGSMPKTVYAIRAGGEGALAEDADTVVVSVAFANGSAASIVYVSAGEASFSKERIEIAGAGRTAVIEDFRRTTLYADGRSRSMKTAQNKGHATEMKTFIEAVKAGAEPVAFAELYAVTAATLAVEESLACGKPVAL